MSEICSYCGAEISSKALACPACGSDEQTGWSEDTMYDGLDLPDDFQEDVDTHPNKMVLIVVVILLIAFVVTTIWL